MIEYMNLNIKTMVNYGYIRFINQNRILQRIKNQNSIQYKNRVAIAISTNNNFLTQTKVMVASLENAGCRITLYILNVNLTNEETKDIKSVAPKNVEIVVLSINEDILRKLKISEKWPIEAWARVLIPELIDEDIVIYMDVDTVVVDELLPLIEMVECKPIAGVLSTFYFRVGLSSIMPNAVNSGVLVMHKKELNVLDFSNNVLKFAKSHSDELQMPDQDSINNVCKDNMGNIAPRFNSMNYFYAHTFRTISKYTVGGYYTKEEFNEALYRPAIIHFNGGPFVRPWIKQGIKHPYYKIYKYYNKKIACNKK